MVLLTVLALGAGGGAVAGVAGWKDYTKPFIEKQIATLVGKLGPSFLGGSKCKLEQVSLTLGGVTTIVLSGLEIDNLPPYSEGELIRFDKMTIVLDVKKTMDLKFKKVQLSTLNVEGCHLLWEKDVLSSNLDTFMKALNDQQAKPEADNGKAKKEKPIALDEVSITDVKVKIAAHVVGSMSTPGAEVPVPSIQIKGFSEKYGDVTLHKLITTIFTDIFQGASKVASSFFETAKLKMQQGAGIAVQEAEDASSTIGSWFSSWFSAEK